MLSDVELCAVRGRQAACGWLLQDQQGGRTRLDEFDMLTAIRLLPQLHW